MLRCVSNYELSFGVKGFYFYVFAFIKVLIGGRYKLAFARSQGTSELAVASYHGSSFSLHTHGGVRLAFNQLHILVTHSHCFLVPDVCTRLRVPPYRRSGTYGSYALH